KTSCAYPPKINEGPNDSESRPQVLPLNVSHSARLPNVALASHRASKSEYTPSESSGTGLISQDGIVKLVAEAILNTDDCLSLEDVIALALAHNPTIPQSRALVHQQQGATVQAGLYPNPQIGYVRSDPDRVGQSRTSGIFLGQEFVTAGKLRLATQASRYDVQLRYWQVTAQEQRVINDVRIRFLDLVAAQEAQRVTEELMESAKDGLTIAQTMLDSKIGTKPDVIQAEIQLSAAEKALYDASLRCATARRQLEAIVGFSLGDHKAAFDLETDSPTLDWDNCLQRLLEESPLLKSQAFELEAARTEIQLADAQAVPNVTAQMVVQRDLVEDFSSIGTFVAVPAPVFNRNQGNRHSARAFYAQQAYEYERLKLALSDQLAQSLQQYQSLQYELNRLDREVIPRATQNLELSTEAYKLGRLDFQRVVDARMFLFQSKLSLIETSIDLHKTLVEIDGLQLTGGLNPTEVGTALQTSGNSSSARRVLSQQNQTAQGTTSRNLPGALQAGDF
ncbi:MAG: TolC family protein, partial [Planctomycetes bacterium]|nr:TolC family protein [Planctomycetota bacterium]